MLFQTKPCVVCGQTSTLEIDAESYRKWNEEGMMVQDVFPHLSRSMREMLITGTHPICWDEEFKDDTDEEMRTDYGMKNSGDDEE